MRHTVWQWFDSLVNRAVALVIAVIVLTAAIMTLVNSQVGRQELEAQAGEQVKTIAGLIASGLDQQLAERFEVLADVASSLTMEQVTYEQRAQLLVDRQVALHHLFDDVFLFDQHGTVLGKYPFEQKQIGADASFRDYFRQTSLQLTALISEPFISRPDQQPTVMMTAPVFDHNQRFIGVLGGAITLTTDNFMEQVADTRVGKSGYVGIATRSGITLAHFREAEVMQPLPSSNTALTEAVAGFEGTRFTRSSQGVDTMISFRQMNQAPWFVAVVWPLEEAFAPVSRLTDIMLWITLSVIAVLAPLALWGFRRLLTPLAQLNVQIRDRHLGVRMRPVFVGGGREVRQVADSFNVVMDERAEVLASLVEREAFFRSLSQSAPIGIVQTDVLGRIEFVNPAFECIMGRDQGTLQDQYLISGVYEEDRVSTLHAWRGALRNNQVYRGKFRIRDASTGQLAWVDAMTASIQTPEKSIGTITVVRNITHELEVEEQLRTEQSRAESILGVLQEGVLLTDSQGMVRYANRAACTFIGAATDCVGSNFFETVRFEIEDDTWTVDDFLKHEEIESLSTVVRNARNQLLELELTMLRLSRGGHNERLVFVLRDDSERRRQEERLSWEATHDSLTGLLNRRAFNSTLLQWLGESQNLGRESILMLIDLDNFKPVNDRGGHLFGDELLRRLAGRLTDAVRHSDFVARVGGDEFGIILPGCGLERAERLAEQIRTSVAELRIEKDGASYGVTASIGLTEISARDSGPRETIARADEGCYAAKAQGRNTVVIIPAPPEHEDG